jgi:anti-sigma-K factor RskA
VSQFSTELGSYKTKVLDLESQIARYRKIMDAQAKGVEEHQQVVSLLASPNVSIVHLHSPGGQSVSGVVLIADDARLAFLPSHLPTAPSGRTYQVWLMRDRVPAAVSVGTFTTADPGGAALQFGNKQLISGTKSVMVTLEPAGGSAEPSAHRVLIGAVKN